MHTTRDIVEIQVVNVDGIVDLHVNIGHVILLSRINHQKSILTMRPIITTMCREFKILTHTSHCYNYLGSQ